MTLRLSITSEHGTRLGTQSSKVFGVQGGTIGRGTDNEWSLPDPERYLSGKHIRIDFRAGAYVLVDTSSNGVYVNGLRLPVGKDHDYVLKDGDHVRLGEYELLVSLANDLDADLDLNELLEPGDSPGAMSWHMMTRPLRAAPPAAPTALPAPNALTAPKALTAPMAPGTAPPGLEAGLVAFCRGAGVDPRTITTEARASALQLAGQLLRETLLGLMDLNQGRSEFRNRFRLPVPADDGPGCPLSFSGGVDETLVRLLTTLSKRALPVEAIRENFRELKAQHAATLTAMHAAFEEFLGRVDPQELEERFDRGAKRGVFGAQNKDKYWALYAEMFAGLVQRPADGFPHLFNEAFAKAYAAKLRALIPPRRSGFGADRDEAADQDHASAGR